MFEMRIIDTSNSNPNWKKNSNLFLKKINEEMLDKMLWFMWFNRHYNLNLCYFQPKLKPQYSKNKMAKGIIK